VTTTILEAVQSKAHLVRGRSCRCKSHVCWSGVKPYFAMSYRTKGPNGSRLGRPAQGDITAFALKNGIMLLYL
jgi:hypothetical protein